MADAATETPEDFGEDDAGLVRRWLAEIAAYDKAFEGWSKRSAAIVKRYRDERDVIDGGRPVGGDRFNILWSNVQTLQPALYSRRPEPVVVRRYKDRDEVGLAAAEILERCVSYGLDVYDFDGRVKAARDDYLLAGRGQLWVRYVPYFGEEVTERIELQALTDNGDSEGAEYLMPDGSTADPKTVKIDEQGLAYVDDVYRPVAYEEVVCDYIAWEDFGHTPAPTWPKVPAVWKREQLTREQLIDRFGKEIGKEVGLTKTVGGMSDDLAQPFGDVFKRAEVYEIWDSATRRAIWISPGYTAKPLDMKDDPLRLSGFFPCPKPLFATMTGNTLVPVPDYAEYQNQAHEIDTLTRRIGLLLKAIRVAGAYDAQNGDALQGMLDGEENNLVPVDNWAMFAERGGVQGGISFLPIKDIADVLTSLVAAREQMKRDLYEITGLSDIVRGQQSGQKATATEQRIKGQFASLRLQDRQAEMQRFIRDVLRLKAEIIAEHFSPATLMEMSGWMQTATARALDRKAQESRAKAVAAIQAGATAVGPAPSIPEVSPTAEEVFRSAVALLRSDRLRSFRIDIETDSTIIEDLQQEKQARIEFLTALGGFLDRAMSAATQYPQLARPLAEALFFGIRGFRAGRGLEMVFEQAIDEMTNQPAPAPGAQGQDQLRIAEINAQAQREQARAQVDSARLQLDAQKASSDAQMDRLRFQADEAERQRQHAIDLRRLELDEAGLRLKAMQAGESAALDRAQFIADQQEEEPVEEPDEEPETEA